MSQFTGGNDFRMRNEIAQRGRPVLLDPVRKEDNDHNLLRLIVRLHLPWQSAAFFGNHSVWKNCLNSIKCCFGRIYKLSSRRL